MPQHIVDENKELDMLDLKTALHQSYTSTL
jgi:hypothetical protein